jgi:hypothetical protein
VTSWLKANGGLVGVAAFFLSVGLTLVFQRGLVLVQVIGGVFLAVALSIGLLGLESIQRRIPWKLISRKELSAEFWERAFEALPFPAFVKELPQDRHIKDNVALTRFQGKKPGENVARVDLADLIQQDHQHGDSMAEREGLSVQLELTDKVTTLKPRSILTLKSCIAYDNQKYVVGCYVPVILPADIPSGTAFAVAECGGQVLFCCPSPAAGDNLLLVTIGKSIQETAS